MSIDKDEIILIIVSLLITILIIVCIKFIFVRCNNNDFAIISKRINQERVQLI
jgi:hypothetical protein